MFFPINLGLNMRLAVPRLRRIVFGLFFLLVISFFLLGCPYALKSSSESSCQSIEFKESECSAYVQEDFSTPTNPTWEIIFELPMKGDENAQFADRTIEVPGLPAVEARSWLIAGFKYGINCNSFTKTKITFSKSDFYGKPFPLPAPSFFDGKEAKVTMIFQNDKGKTWDGSFKATITYTPCSPPPVPSSTPIVRASSFNSLYCSSDLTISASQDNSNYDLDVVLFAGSKLLENAKNGEKQVDASPLNIKNKIVSNVFTWESDGRYDNYYFQIAVSQGKGTCWSDYKYSSYVSLGRVTCIAPKVDIVSVNNKDGSTALGRIIEMKNEAPLSISVSAKGENDDYVSKLELKVYYDKTNVDHKSYYESKFPSGVIQTIEKSFSSKPTGDIYNVNWNGRDGSSGKRLPLGGKYNVEVAATFLRGTQKKVSFSLQVEKPGLLNFTNNYPGTATDLITKCLGDYNADPKLFEFDKRVTFLTESIDKNFEWVRQFGNIGSSIPATGFNKNQKFGPTIQETDLVALESKTAIFNYVGHAGITSGSLNLPFLLFLGNKLYSNCTATNYSTPCGTDPAYTGLCLDINCSGVNRSSTSKLFMDDVLLAVLNGCMTDYVSGTEPTMSQRFLDHGVDCVIGVKSFHILVQMMNFWNYHFYDELINQKEVVKTAAENAYNLAVDDLRFLYPGIPDDAAFPVVQKYFGTYKEETVNRFSLETFINTFTIQDNPKNSECVSELSVLPARYGESQY
jgi:hypothetical protein